VNSLAIRSLAARRGRTSLSIVGIALGIAVLFASLATDAGIGASIDRTVRDLVGRADLRVEAFGPAGLSAASLAAIEEAPGVAVAAPALERRTYLVPAIDEPDAAPKPITALGVDPARESSVRDLLLASGTTLTGPDAFQALISQTLATASGTALGGTITFQAGDAPVDLTVVGIIAGDGPIIGSAGRTVILPRHTQPEKELRLLLERLKLELPAQPPPRSSPGTCPALPPARSAGWPWGPGSPPVSPSTATARSTSPITIITPSAGSPPPAP